TMRFGVVVPILALLSWSALPIAPAGEAAPPPAAAETDAANDLPLDLYKKIRRSFEALLGMATGEDAKISKDDAKKALASDAAAHKAELIKALKSSQVIHRELSAMALEHCGDAKAAVEAL